MIVTIVVGLFSVLFAYLAKYKNAQWGLKVSFFLIFLFLALRYNFGNDYNTYLYFFSEISQYDLIDVFDKSQVLDLAWILLNWLFRSFGFFAMTAVLAFFNSVVYYRFIKKYVPGRYYWLAVFIYIFYPEFLLIHSSAMRQSVAIMIFIFSLDYLYKKDAIRYFLCIGIASLFHLSALILLPVYFLGLLNRKISKVNRIFIISIFISLILLGESLSPFLKQFIGKYFIKYEIYQEAGSFNTGLGFLYLFLMLILTLYFERLQKKEIALVFKIAIFGFIMMPFNLIIELIGRLGLYFTPATIIVYPIILMNLKKPVSKIIYLTLLLTFITYKFFQFFYSDVYRDAYAVYQTIFSAPQW